MSDLKLRRDELVSNPTARVAVCLCLDTSGSMSGPPIAELNAGVLQFFQSLNADEVARYAAEISIVTFSDSATKVVDFGPLSGTRAPTLTASGLTAMGEGVVLALDLLESRKNEYAQAGIDYYQPWLVLMTDGGPTGPIEVATQRTAALIEQRKLTVFSIGIGGSADMNVLSRFAPNRPPLRLQGLNFKKFFEWLSRSVSRVSESIPGDEVSIDEEGIKGWSDF